jgi:hypothetical protein
VMNQIEKGNKFVVVNDDFDKAFIPQGYTMIDMVHKGDSFKALVPYSLLFYMVNKGEGDVNDALDELTGFYGNAEDYEDEMITNGNTSVQETNWATLAKSSYHIYLINKLVKHKKFGKDDDGEPIAEFNENALSELDLYDDFVEKRAKAIAALVLGKSVDDIKKTTAASILKHVTIQHQKTEKMTKEEFKEVTCWAGSHYELKSEYACKDDVSYSIEKMHDKGRMVGYKQMKKIDVECFDTKVQELEKEIADYRTRKRGTIGKHDFALTRQYINIINQKKQ